MPKIDTTELPEMKRVIIGLDPACMHDDMSGIIAAGLGGDGKIYVLADQSDRLKPDEWALRTIKLYDDIGAAFIKADTGLSGDFVERCLRHHAPHVLFKPSRLSRRPDRLYPVAAAYETGRMPNLPRFPQLIDQLFKAIDDRHYPSDRADALALAFDELSDISSREPRIRIL